MTISSSITCEECGGTFAANRIIFGCCTKCFIKRDIGTLNKKEGYDNGYNKGYHQGYDEGYKNGCDNILVNNFFE